MICPCPSFLKFSYLNLKTEAFVQCSHSCFRGNESLRERDNDSRPLKLKKKEIQERKAKRKHIDKIKNATAYNLTDWVHSLLKKYFIKKNNNNRGEGIRKKLKRKAKDFLVTNVWIASNTQSLDKEA